MKSCILLTLLAGLAVGQNDYDYEIFKHEIDVKCLSRLWTNHNGQRDVRPSGRTLASFIHMVEQVEGNNTDWSIYDVSKALLKRFAFEGIEFKAMPDRAAVQSDDAGARWKITKKLVGENSNSMTFVESNLSEEDKCSMFFMMGHLVNDTFRDGFDDDSSLSEAPAENPAGGSGGVLRAPTVKSVKQPREQGVVSVHGSKEQAVAIALVLNAILASNNDKEHETKELYGTPSSMKIRPLIAVTLGEVLTRAARRPSTGNNGAEKFFGPGGFWNSTLCPTEYNLRENVLDVTTALLRGAVDGILIGKALKEELSGIQGARLSRVLRMYYSRKGLPKPNSQEPGYSYCRRDDVNGAMDELGGAGSVISYYKTYGFVRFTQEPTSEDPINNAINQLNAAIQSLHQNTGTEECRARDQSTDQPTCETPSNVLVILDNSERNTEGFTEQEDIVGMLANRLDFGRGSGTLSIFQAGLNGKRLKEVAFNATNPTSATCKTAWIEQSQLSRPDGEFQLMEALNQTLGEFERKVDLEPGVPNKVVVLFHYDEIKDKNNRLKQAGTMLRDGHRDTRILAVGNNKDGLSPLVSGDTNVISGSTDPDIIAKDLTSRICKVPAVFQFNRCYDHKNTRNEAKNVYVGYVTDNHVQFWAFYPEYFLKSYDVKIKFRADGGDIVVCEQRGVENPGYSNGVLNRQRCKKTDGANRELTFTFSNPCEKYEVHNCPTINFAIIGDGKASRTLGCPDGDMKCRRFDQIKFQMSHDGISCSGCEFLKSSPLIIAVIFIFSMFRNRH